MDAKQAEATVEGWPARADEDALQDACRQTHSALQWLARVENSYNAAAGERAVEMRWLPAERAFLTGAFAEDVSLELRLPQFVLQFREDGVPTRYPFHLDENSPAEIEAWVLIELLHRNIDRDRFSKDLPYDVSQLMTGDASHFRTEGMEDAFQDLADWLCAADALLHAAAERAGGAAAGAEHPVLLRPETFALFVRVPSAAGAPADTEIGFAAGRGSPRFYVARGGAPNGDRARGSSLPAARIVDTGMDRDAVLAFLLSHTA